MRTPIVFLALAVVLLASPVSGAQTPAPLTTGTLMRMSLDGLPPDYSATIGIIRTTFDVGGSLRAAAGSGPALHFIETGTLTVRAGDSTSAVRVVRAGADPELATPEEFNPGSAMVLEAGDAFVLAAGAAAEFRNDGVIPAAVLDLMAATDVMTEAETGITRAVLVQREATFPDPPLLVTLDRVTLAPGDRLSLPPAPAEAIFATVERSMSFLLSGEGINRGTKPMEVYVLAITSDAVPSATAP